ncbi:phage tail assembly chaperone family protein, TAC [Pseudomonas syringae group genomosp. 3]|uniref:Lambda gpG-like protein n=1 Tax=Pseudomonas syringae pv. persicae TaxID=237306 RepID=A0AB38EAF9_9PSED|nr:phage tail assembly chaperone family protein, TAC [Pseudomonas syringae group genomosp. 3]SOQ06551.1 lambda gpG-like protein [Pseudomonas syringae pv. persicae]SOQ06828.1 lambda gpG-like protein [Pseudomonas syringae pv. persicae]
MILSIENLKAAGSFVGQPVKQEIVWHSGGKEHKGEVFVRMASYETVTKEWKDQNSNHDMIASRIANFVCDERGQPIFTVEDVLGSAEEGRGPLGAELTIALFAVIGNVNKPRAPEEKKPLTGSGTDSSSLALVEKPSRKPRRT